MIDLMASASTEEILNLRAYCWLNCCQRNHDGWHRYKHEDPCPPES